MAVKGFKQAWDDICGMDDKDIAEEIANLRNQVDSLKGENRKHRADKKELQTMLEENRAAEIAKHNDLVSKSKQEACELRHRISNLEAKLEVQEGTKRPTFDREKVRELVRDVVEAHYCEGFAETCFDPAVNALKEELGLE